MKEAIPGTLKQGEWLSKILPSGGKVGVDPFLISYESWKNLSKELDSSGHMLVPVTSNLIDAVWEERPAPPNSAINPLSIKYTGLSCKVNVFF